MAAFLAAVALLATSSGGEIDRLPTHTFSHPSLTGLPSSLVRRQ